MELDALEADGSAAAGGGDVRVDDPVGDPLEPDTVIGPVISAVQRGRIEVLVAAGVSEGGELVVGGARPDMERGYYVAPTLIAGCKASMRAVREEFSGPVVVLPFDDEDEGVVLANSTDYGLYDYVFTGDTARGVRVARPLRSGNVGINTASGTTRPLSAGSS